MSASTPPTASIPARVLLVCRALPWHVPGGLEFHTLDLARGLAAAGVEVHLLASALPPEQATAARAELGAAGITLHELVAGDPRRYTLAWLRRVGPAVEALHARLSFTLIHGQEFALGCWRPRPTAPPVVLTVHGTITSETPLHPDVYSELGAADRLRAWLHYGRRHLFTPLWRRQLLAARAILIDSAFTRGELLARWPALRERLHLVPLGVPPTPGGVPGPTPAEARARLGWSDGAPRLVTIGRLEWSKGHTLALEALARLRALPWHYAIAGAGSTGEALRRRVAELGLGPRVQVLGRVDGATRARLLAAGDLFLWPERTHPAFGLVGFEALAAGLPVLAARRGAIPEVLASQAPAWQSAGAVAAAGSEGGAWFGQREPWLVDAADPAAWATRLRVLLERPERLAALRAALANRQPSGNEGGGGYRAMIEGTLAAYAATLR